MNKDMARSDIIALKEAIEREGVELENSKRAYIEKVEQYNKRIKELESFIKGTK